MNLLLFVYIWAIMSAKYCHVSIFMADKMDFVYLFFYIDISDLDDQ